jgi:hypothetical protein
MAGREPSIPRRALLGAAAALPIAALAPPALSAARRSAPRLSAALDCRASLAMTWEARLARYRRLAERAKAAVETGWFRAANDLYNRQCADPAADRKAAFARIDRAEDLYWLRCTAPMQQAALALASTPVPDLPALRQKMAVMRTHELDELGCMTRSCLEVLEEDVGRLAQ